MLKLDLLPACEGDCLILTWGEEARPRRLLIDAGRKATAQAVLDYAQAHRLSANAFELFVITHIDRDHIEGAVELLKREDFRKLVREIWFNGRHNLEYADPQNLYEEFGALDGERLTRLILANEMHWNTSFGESPVAVVDEAQLPRVELPDGLVLTILSPDPGQLQALAQPWDEAIAAAPEGWESFGQGESIALKVLAEKKFKGDGARPNGSSIALVAEIEGKAILLTGDAHVPRLVKSLRTYRAANPLVRFVAAKAAHHGSRGNTSLELVEIVDCPNWLISTNGAQFQHPDPEAIARIIWGNAQPVTLLFNYRTEFNGIWAGPVQPKRPFSARFGNGSISLDISA